MLGYFGTSWVNFGYYHVVNIIYSDNEMSFKCRILRLTFWSIGLSALIISSNYNNSSVRLLFECVCTI
jgi:hypothetical protein